MRILRLIAFALVASLAASAQITSQTASSTSLANGPANVAGLLYAANFGHWTVSPSQNGNQWTNYTSCYGTSGGITFPLWATNAPVTIVDNANSSNTETVTPTVVNYSGNGCSVGLPATHAHSNYYLKSGTAGLQEALNWAGGTNAAVVVTPDWTTLGGTSAMLLVAVKGTNSIIVDGRLGQPSIGTKFTITSGCSTSATSGGGLAGAFTASSTTCSPVITPGVTAPNGFACSVTDLTTGSATIRETSYTTTTVTFTGASLGSTDQFVFSCGTF